MASIEELTDQSRTAILAGIMDRGRAVTAEQYVARDRIEELEGALRSIKNLCAGDRIPRWANQDAVTNTRNTIMDICTIADEK